MLGNKMGVGWIHLAQDTVENFDNIEATVSIKDGSRCCDQISYYHIFKENSVPRGSKVTQYGYSVTCLFPCT